MKRLIFVIFSLNLLALHSISNAMLLSYHTKQGQIVNKQIDNIDGNDLRIMSPTEFSGADKLCATRPA